MNSLTFDPLLKTLTTLLASVGATRHCTWELVAVYTA